MGEKRYRWYGHLKRMGNDKLSSLLMNWQLAPRWYEQKRTSQKEVKREFDGRIGKVWTERKEEQRIENCDRRERKKLSVEENLNEEILEEEGNFMQLRPRCSYQKKIEKTVQRQLPIKLYSEKYNFHNFLL